MARKGREWAARRLPEPLGRVPLVRWDPPEGDLGPLLGARAPGHGQCPSEGLWSALGGAWRAGEQAWMGGGGSLADSEPLGRQPHEAAFRVHLPGSASRLY